MSYTKKTVVTVQPYRYSIFAPIDVELNSTIKRLVQEGKIDADRANASNYVSSPPTPLYDSTAYGNVSRTVEGDKVTWVRHWVDESAAQEWIDAMTTVYAKYPAVVVKVMTIEDIV